MLYLSTPSSLNVRLAMRAGIIGCVLTPKPGSTMPDEAIYACDNGKFGKGWPGHLEWFFWLVRTVERYGVQRCLFATAPDVPFNARQTLAESLPWLPAIRTLGIPAAFVAQDGSEAPELIPWGKFDVLFLGGSTEWKLGEGAAGLAREAKARGVSVHMGRVNSRKRLNIASALGCASADGTYLAFGPDINLARLISWLSDLSEAEE